MGIGRRLLGAKLGKGRRLGGEGDGLLPGQERVGDDDA